MGAHEGFEPLVDRGEVVEKAGQVESIEGLGRGAAAQDAEEGVVGIEAENALDRAGALVTDEEERSRLRAVGEEEAPGLPVTGIDGQPFDQVPGHIFEDRGRDLEPQPPVLLGPEASTDQLVDQILSTHVDPVATREEPLCLQQGRFLSGHPGGGVRQLRVVGEGGGYGLVESEWYPRGQARIPGAGRGAESTGTE
ncbi:MAG TPA: hypothetical protein P5144_10155 [Thermoanaerobaculia bacterium]|nr:hypothetical protein [Thermoanaerobaculia bacterium]